VSPPAAGILVLDKPAGPTSHDLVALARRHLRIRQIGHTGTLDPMATGVLVLCVGRATRVARFLIRGEKVYSATLRLGWGTDTGDCSGRPLHAPRPVDLRAEQVAAAMRALTGARLQTPPAYSAKKVGGVRAYRLARAGVPVAPAAAPVEVRRLELTGMEGEEVAFEVHCSAGTYVRTLAQEIGDILGCGAHLTALRRTRSGEFCLADAISPAALAARSNVEPAADLLLPLARLRMGLPEVTVDGGSLVRLARGGDLAVEALRGDVPPPGSTCRVVDTGGRLVALGTVEAGRGTAPRLQPRVVLLDPPARAERP